MAMTEAQFNITLQALRFVFPLVSPADVSLSRFFRESPKLGAADRHLVAETTFALLRRYRFLETLCGETVNPRRLLLACLVRTQGYGLREVQPFTRGEEQDWVKSSKAIELSQLSLAVQADMPDWLWDLLLEQEGEAGALALGRSWQQPAPLDLRVNSFKASRDTVLAQLQAEGLPAFATPYSPFGIRLTEKIALQRHPLFLDGTLEVQDEGSQLLGLLLAPKRGEMVADFCAGAGGKTLLLGAIMHSQGRLYAFDVAEKRLANLKVRLKRSGLSNVHPQLIAHENDIKIKRLAGKMARVLVDAPCSGLGTLRRNPDLKWRQTAEAITELCAKQTRILNSAANLVKVGGRLVYATCSILARENQQIVEAFLAAHPDFVLLPAGAMLAEQKIPLEMGDYLTLSPQIHQTDGFFAAVLERKHVVSH